LVITIAAVVVSTLLVILFIQLRKTAKEGEETLRELRGLILNLKNTNQKFNARIDDAGEIVEASKKTAASLAEIAFFISTRIIRPSSKYWPFIFPLIRLGWRQIKRKKQKEEKNGK
jgi:hypothetical protein